MRFCLCFSLRGSSLKRRAAVPPRMLCFAQLHPISKNTAFGGSLRARQHDGRLDYAPLYVDAEKAADCGRNGNGLAKFPAAADGCLLVDSEVGSRYLRMMFQKVPQRHEKFSGMSNPPLVERSAYIIYDHGQNLFTATRLSQ